MFVREICKRQSVEQIPGRMRNIVVTESRTLRIYARALRMQRCTMYVEGRLVFQVRARRSTVQWAEEALEKRPNKIPSVGRRTNAATQSPRLNRRKPEREKRGSNVVDPIGREKR